MHKIKTGTGPAAFRTTFKMPYHSNSTRLLGYVKVGSGYLYEVQLYRTILLLIQRKNLNLALFLNQK